MPCPHCLTGCPNCTAVNHPPLTRAQEDAIERALTRAGYPRPARLRIVTMPAPTAEPECEGTYHCPCQRCTTQRAVLRPQGSGNADPFRKARRAA